MRKEIISGQLKVTLIERDRPGKGRIYADELEHEYKALRRPRPRQLAKAIAAAKLTELGLLTEGEPLVWSQKAGCSCGCSPGFIAPRPLIDGGRQVDVWIKRASEVDLAIAELMGTVAVG